MGLGFKAYAAAVFALQQLGRWCSTVSVPGALPLRPHALTHLPSVHVTNDHICGPEQH